MFLITKLSSRLQKQALQIGISLFLITCACQSAHAQSGLTFDGTNDYVDITGSASSLALTTGTVEAWIKPSALPAGLHGIVVKQNAYGIFLFGSEVAMYDWTSGNLVTSSAVLVGAWTHVAITFQSGVPNGTIIYVNGVASPTTTMTVNSDIHTLGLGSGRTVPPPDQLFTGTIDEVRVWNVVRTQTQLQSNQSCEFTTMPAGLVAYYKLNQSSGMTATAAVGSNGTLTNFNFTPGSTWDIGNTSIAGSCTILAADLVEFSAKKAFGGKDIELDWETANEKGRNVFEVERSSNGKDFKQIAVLKGIGYASNYHFVDTEPLSGNNYYRLKVNDLDADKYYSKIMTVVGDVKDKVSISPTIIRNECTINGAKTAEVVNMMGQVVIQSQRTEGTTTLSLTDIPNGMYIIRGQNTEGGLFSKKVFVSR
jgi:Concanavalin A-like lectin/glucanases superfamily